MADTRVIPGGKFYFDKFDSAGALTGERYLGGSKAAPLTATPESIDDYSNETTGIGVKADSTVIKTDYSFTVELASIEAKNLAISLLGLDSVTTMVSTPHTAEPINNVEPGLRYQLPSAGRPQGARGISAVTVKDDAATPVTFTVGVDYTVDLVTGGIEPIVGGGIVKGTNLRVDYTEDAKSWEAIVVSGVEIQGAVRMLGATSKGPVRDYYFPKCNITPNGDFLIKGDPEQSAYQRISLRVEVLKKDNDTAPFYVDGVPA